MTRYQYLKNCQRCVACSKQDENTLSGHARCAECAEKYAEYSRRFMEKHHDEVRQREKERYHNRAEQGLCVTCGKRQAAENHVNCEECAEYFRQQHFVRKGKKNDNC